MYIYTYIPYIYTRFIDGVTMFRAIKTVARVDDGGASVSIRRQLTSPPGIPIRRMERWSLTWAVI